MLASTCGIRKSPLGSANRTPMLKAIPAMLMLVRTNTFSGKQPFPRRQLSAGSRCIQHQYLIGRIVRDLPYAPGSDRNVNLYRLLCLRAITELEFDFRMNGLTSEHRWFFETRNGNPKDVCFNTSITIRRTNMHLGATYGLDQRRTRIILNDWVVSRTRTLWS